MLHSCHVGMDGLHERPAVSWRETKEDPLDNSDPRYVRSRLKLRKAFLELADIDPTALSVSAICERTGTDRATFYRHFDDLDGLVEDALGSLADEGTAKWLRMSEGTGRQVEESVAIMTAYLTHIADHWGVYQWALGEGGSARVIHSLLKRSIAGVDVELAKLYGESENTDYLSWFMSGAVLGTLVHWLADATPQRAPEDVARWILSTAMSVSMQPAS